MNKKMLIKTLRTGIVRIAWSPLSLRTLILVKVSESKSHMLLPFKSIFTKTHTNIKSQKVLFQLFFFFLGGGF